MPAVLEESKLLPRFRVDLRVFPGPEEPDGSPTYNIQDPVTGKYFLFTWAEFLIFQRANKGLTAQRLVKNLEETTTLRVTEEQVNAFFLECFKHGLLAVNLGSDEYKKSKIAQKTNIFLWILYNYLFMRIPLFNPDKFLARTLPLVKFLGSTPAFFLYGMISLSGILLLFLRFGEFVNSFSFFFNFEGLLGYFLAIFIVKIVHEFSHAYVAKRYGLYVPSMGLALIVLFPVLYTDVTDGWKISSRKYRMYISGAGVMAETIIAGLCTVGWFLTQPGVLNNIFFVVSSATWVSTLLINLNPAIRFDGYYLLSDLWGVDNLQGRTFNVARWKLREIFLGIFSPCPEPRIPIGRIVGFIAYALYTLIYRLFLYTAIALFVYHTFTKALGIFLFFVEIGIFILWPLAWEIMELRKIKEKITCNPRLIMTLCAICLFLGWAILPLPHTQRFPGVVAPKNQQIVYVPLDSIVKRIFINRGEVVEAGKTLVQLDSPVLNFDIISQETDNKLLAKQIDILSFDDTQKSFIPSKQAELATGQEKLAGLRDLREELNLKSKIGGQVYDWNENLRVGLSLSKDFVLGKIANPKDTEIIFFVPEEDLKVVQENQSVKFLILATGDEVRGKVTAINPISPQSLAYPALASIYKGKVAVNPDPVTKKMELLDAYYTVHVDLEDSQAQLFFGKTGDVEVRGPWRSKLVSLIEEIRRILWREGSI